MVERGLSVQLLVDDGAHQGLENGLAVGDFVGADALNDGGEHGVGFLQVLDGLFHDFSR